MIIVKYGLIFLILINMSEYVIRIYKNTKGVHRDKNKSISYKNVEGSLGFDIFATIIHLILLIFIILVWRA